MWSADSRPAGALAPRTAWRATAWYVLATVAMTWPLATVVASGIPKDLGDPLLNCWILGWNADHLLRALGGDPGALGELWHGNIFYPERYTLGYSELLIAQTLQILPVYAATKNLVLCYNLLFLSTFVLSGLGMYVLVRALVGDWRAAFVAGLFYAFLPYRFHQAPHLQVLSTQWMPFALAGFHRAVATRRSAPLAGGALALLAQNLSCGYFLVFFSIFVPPFVVFEMARHGRLRDARLWAAFAIAAAAVGVLTVPFMQPYFALRELHDTHRRMDELSVFSADTWSYLTTEPETTIWSRWLRLLDKPEGALFPGALPVLFAAVASILGLRRAWRATAGAGAVLGEAPVMGASTRRERFGRALLWLGAACATWGLLGIALIVTGNGGLFRAGALRVRIQSLTRALDIALVGTALILWLSPRARAFGARLLRSPLAFLAACAAAAAYLSLGPDPQAGRDSLNGPAVYAWLYHAVPGFDGLRVPARFAAVAMLFLVMVAAWGVRGLLHRWPRRAPLLAIAIGALWLVEAAVVPFPIGVSMSADTPSLNAPPSTVATGDELPPIYRLVRQLPADVVLLEFPIGDVSWELQHVYNSTLHWRRLVNGYSGYSPRPYLELVDALRNPYRSPEAAWRKTLDAGVTHVIVHGRAYPTATPPAPFVWLEQHGAVLLARTGQDHLYKVPGR